MINFEELRNFIAEARKNTYASEGKPVENPLVAGSYQLEYEKRDFLYRDIYFTGKENFIGQEVISLKDDLIWSMVYCGSAEPPEVTDFFKKSLSILAEKCRFNEECEFEEDRFKYKNEGEGTLERFHGKETISINGEKIYKLKYQGGSIEK